jgi:hypothetical protein
LRRFHKPPSFAFRHPFASCLINSTQPFPHASIPSFTTSTNLANFGLNAQPLANVCSTWLLIDPGIPSVAITLPGLTPLCCVLLIIMVPTTKALSLATSLLPNQALTFVASTAQLCAQLCSRMHAYMALCRSMHQSSVLPTHAAAPAPRTSPCHFLLPPVPGVNFTLLPASGLVHLSAAALPWLSRALEAIHLLASTNPLCVCVIKKNWEGLNLGGTCSKSNDGKTLQHYGRDLCYMTRRSSLGAHEILMRVYSPRHF